MWEILESRDLYRAGAVGVRCDQVQSPSGEPAEYLVLDGPPVSMAVPCLDDGRIVLVRQFRHAWRQATWECPAGHAEPGESPEAAALRELAEETGYRAARLERLHAIRPSARQSSVFTLFLASGLASGPPAPDADEEIEVGVFTPAAVRRLLENGELIHGPSVTAVALALLRLGLPMT
jgi:ADP-ribose pyrophosphatase